MVKILLPFWMIIYKCKTLAELKIWPQLNFTDELMTIQILKWILNPRSLWKLLSNTLNTLKTMKIVKITFQDCGDCLRTGSRASARCRSSTQTQASLKGKVSEWNSRCWCWRFLLVFNPFIFLFLFWFGLLNMYAIYCVGVSSEC